MATTQIVHCPNCGCLAQRDFIPQAEMSASVAHKCSADPFIIRTMCHQCDYLMTQCPRSNAVLEAHAPGLSSLLLQAHQPTLSSAPSPSVL
ncbi:MAG: hypothetical protein AAGC54_04345 [Cyanobacteria bacterium P01_F01_bin.4]